MKAFRLLALGAVGALATTGCGDSPGEGASAPDATVEDTTVPASSGPGSTSAASVSSAPAPTTVAPDLTAALAGRTFLSTAVEGFTLVAGTTISLTFDGSNIGADGGCNQLGSTWTLEDDVLVVAPMAQTEMACDPPAKMDQETWLSSVLTSRPTLTLDGDTLTIAAQGATVTLVDRETANPDRPLEGTVWTVDTLVTGEVASSLPAGARPPSLTFDGGTVAVDAGCNTGTGSYSVADGEITFDAIATTRMACADESVAAMEQHVLTVLTGTAAFTIDADALTLTNGANGLGARAEASAPESAPPEGLVGPAWRLESATLGGLVMDAGQRVPTLSFDGTTVTVDAGCNTGSGGYSAGGPTITFGTILTTLKPCVAPDGSLETTILDVLTGTASYQIGADGALTIANGGITLRYVPS